MAEDTIDQAALLAELEDRPSVTRDLPIHGYHKHAEEFGDLAPYGSDAPQIQALAREDDRLAERIHPHHPVIAAQVVWAAREEMARTVEDVLARRTRMLLLDARGAMEAAPRVAPLLAAELGREGGWVEAQVDGFHELARGYLPA
jgi:glycerol-3-phosphate dehydrogenase